MEPTPIERKDFLAVVDPDVAAIYGLILARRDGVLKCFMPHDGNGPHLRQTESLKVIEAMIQRLPASLQAEIAAWSDIVMQVDDVPMNLASLGWHAKFGWNKVKLLPDIFYVQYRGYEDFAPDVTSWNTRETKVFWRGSTTGRANIHLEEMTLLPRYRLCDLARAIGPSIDAKIVAVVQAASTAEHERIEQHLKLGGMFGMFTPMTEMHQYKFIIDIDGNSCAWSFLARMRLGCCVLRVESEWHQWFVNRFVAWKHFVPVRADFSDLAEKVDWCMSHDAEAAAIAARGRALAQAIRYDSEMDLAAQRLFAF